MSDGNNRGNCGILRQGEIDTETSNKVTNPLDFCVVMSLLHLTAESYCEFSNKEDLAEF